MTIFLLLVAALCFYKLRLPRPVLTGLNEHYLDFDRTTAMKGIFILLVFLTHVVGYIPAYPGPALLHEPYFWVQEKMEQGVVVMFLFYSGYGVMESIKKKGKPYVRAMPKNRVLRTLLHFDLAVLLYIALDAALGTLQDYSLREILLSFTGWEAVGNSNWYIFAVLVLYLATVLSFAVFGSRGKYIPAACASRRLRGSISPCCSTSKARGGMTRCSCIRWGCGFRSRALRSTAPCKSTSGFGMSCSFCAPRSSCMYITEDGMHLPSMC